MTAYPLPQPLLDSLQQLAETLHTPFPKEYEIIYSYRGSIAIEVTRRGEVTVRAPKDTPRSDIEQFLIKKQKWILKHLKNAMENPLPPSPPPLSDSERRRYMEAAREIFTRKTAYYASIMGVTYGRISIREQKTCWGTCSSDGNLSYNWRIILAPENVVDYIVVHELAHRKVHNHTPEFYRVVETVLPDYKKEQKWLKENGAILNTAVKPLSN